MKPATSVLGLFILVICFAFTNYGQQQFTQTVTTQNRNCNAVCSVLDIPALNNNPAAVIFITPTVTNYPHPIGAYYMYLNKWSVFNLDGTALVVGTTFNVEYYATPDSNHFVYVVPPLAHANDVRFIDRAGLNNNPTAQVRVFPTNSPPSGVNGANLNSTEVRADYDLTTSKWFIYNMSSAPVPAGTAYNIKFSSANPTFNNPNSGKDLNNPIPQNPVSNDPTFNNPNSGKELNPKNPATPVTNSTAGGDLNGNYPNPKVIGLQGRPLSNEQPKIGQVLKWGLTGWEPADEATPATPTFTPAPTAMPKSYYGFLTPDYTWTGGSGYEVALPGMSVQITITTPSIVNVSVIAQTVVTTDCGVINNCGGQGTGVNLYRNNTLLVKTLNGGANTSVTQILPNYPDLLSPGTYTYKVFGRRIYSNSNIKYLGASNPDESFKSYLSIQVFPQ